MEMKFRGLYNESGKYVERAVGFHSRDVLYYMATNRPDVTAVILARQGVKEVIYVTVSPSDFNFEKQKAEKADIFTYSHN